MSNEAPTDALRLVPEPRAIADAPRDGTMLRLWVRYPEVGSWTPLEDAYESWTVGFNNLDNTEEDRWQIVGWCWSHDHLLEAADDVEVLGWLPFHGEAAPASPLPGGGCLGAEHLSAAITRLTQVVAGDEVEASYADFTFPGHTFRADVRALLSALPAAPTGEPK